MAQITLHGNAINTVGELPAIGSPAPGFTLTGTDLGPVSADQFRDKPLLLNIFPSVDTPVCADSVRTFNERAAAGGASVLCVSKDLPFAQNRFCGLEDIDKIPVSGSNIRGWNEIVTSVRCGQLFGPAASQQNRQTTQDKQDNKSFHAPHPRLKFHLLLLQHDRLNRKESNKRRGVTVVFIASITTAFANRVEDWCKMG